MYVLNKIEKEYGIKLKEETCVEQIKEIINKSPYAKGTRDNILDYIKENEEKLDIKWAGHFLNFLINLDNNKEEDLLKDYEVLKEYPLSYYTEFEVAIIKEAKDLAEAKTHLKAAVELKENDALASYYLGSLCFKLEEYKEAKLYYKQAQKNAANSPYEKELKARIYYGVGAIEYKDKEDIKALTKNIKGGMNAFNDLKLANTIFEDLGLKEVFETISNELKKELNNSDDKILNLIDYLEEMTKNDLTEIRKSYNIKGASKLNKTQLAEKINEEVPGQLKEKIKLFDMEILLKLTNILDNDNQIVIKDLPYVNYLKRLGILVEVESCLDELKLVIPADIQAMIKEIIVDDQVKVSINENDQLFKIVNGLMQYYGVIEIEEIVKIIEEYKIGYENVYNFIENCGQYSDKLETIHNIVFLRNIKQIKKIMEEKQNYQTVEYSNIPLKDAIIAGTNNGQILSKEQLEVYDYLKSKSKIDESEFDVYFKELVMMLQYNYSADKIMELVELFVDSKNINKNKLTDQVLKLNNHTKLWALKGNEPSEAFKKKPVVSDEKIGRNDSCPCGSGKKYKKCCMNK